MEIFIVSLLSIYNNKYRTERSLIKKISNIKLITDCTRAETAFN